MTLHRSDISIPALALVLGLQLGCAAASEHEMQDTGSTFPEGALVELPGGRIHAVVRGTGPDLIMIHGANGNARDFSFDLIDRMADEFRVIAFDRPGFGFSDNFGGPESPVEQADILRAAAQALGVDQPIVLGHSYGGAVALAWALRAGDDVAGLTLLAPASHPWPGDLGLWYRISGSALGQKLVLPLVAGIAPRSRVEATLAGVFEPDPVPDGYLDHLGMDITLNVEQLQLNARQITSLRSHVEAMAPGYPALTLPIEVLHGTADVTVGLQYHAARLIVDVDSAVLTPLPEIGHMLHHARPDDVAEAIRRTAQRAGISP